uniref:Peptidase S1 domain-containing protein n=1 Tax=Anopheles christyi TaxID=43041 RepID=A0A182JWQ8_9DIPT
MNTILICIVFSLSLIASGQETEDELKCNGGYCVSKHLCSNTTYLDDPKLAQNTQLVGLRLGIEIDDLDNCNDYLLVCCRTAPPPATSTQHPASSEELIEPPPSTNFACGQSNENGLIYDLRNNDTLAQYAEFPWVVYILASGKQSPSPTPVGSDFVCGGTLIHPRFVVTTAHNTDGKTGLVARFGEWDTSTTNEPYPQQEISVLEIIKHPQYVFNPIQNDIALLVLAENVQYAPHIRPICLPQPGDEFVGDRCISNGWGKDRGVYANVMKKITLPVIDSANCTRMLRFAGLGPYYNLREGFLCAGGEANVDMCKGDGGSPLACQTESGTYVLAGIVSWGIGCGGYNFPGVYVAVNRYVHWINEHLECPGGFCSPKYLCPNGTYDETNAQNQAIITLRTDDYDVCQDYMQVCCSNVKSMRYDLMTVNDDDPSEYACGLSNPGGLIYQVEANRTYAQYAEFPWVVAILEAFYSNVQEFIYVGGGTLIHPRFVITAAHIFNRTENLVASFGEWDMNRDENVYPKQAISSTQSNIDIDRNVIIHPEYNSVGLLNDIALAMLKRDVLYAKHIRPICLPNPTDLFDGQLCISTGWGFEARTNAYANVLKRVDLPVVARHSCKQLFAATRLGPFFRLHKSVLCAGGEAGVDMCDGDGGSGLVCPNESGAYVLAGIVSWGLSCHQQDVPGAYVNVARFVTWINATIEEML